MRQARGLSRLKATAVRRPRVGEGMVWCRAPDAAQAACSCTTDPPPAGHAHTGSLSDKGKVVPATAVVDAPRDEEGFGAAAAPAKSGIPSDPAHARSKRLSYWALVVMGFGTWRCGRLARGRSGLPGAARHAAQAGPIPRRRIPRAAGPLLPISAGLAIDYTMSLMSIQPLYYTVAGPDSLYGFVFGSYDLTALLCAPLFGFWTDHSRRFKPQVRLLLLPINPALPAADVCSLLGAQGVHTTSPPHLPCLQVVLGALFNAAGNLVYAFTILAGRWYLMLIARLVAGVGAATLGIGASYITQAGWGGLGVRPGLLLIWGRGRGRHRSVGTG